MQPHHVLLLPPAVVRYFPLPSWCLHWIFIFSCRRIRLLRIRLCMSPPQLIFSYNIHHQGLPSSALVVVILLHQTPSLPANRTRYVKTLRCVFRDCLVRRVRLTFFFFFFKKNQHTFADQSRILSNSTLFDGNASAYGV